MTSRIGRASFIIWTLSTIEEVTRDMRMLVMQWYWKRMFRIGELKSNPSIIYLDLGEGIFLRNTFPLEEALLINGFIYAHQCTVLSKEHYFTLPFDYIRDIDEGQQLLITEYSPEKKIIFGIHDRGDIDYAEPPTTLRKKLMILYHNIVNYLNNFSSLKIVSFDDNLLNHIPFIENKWKLL